MAAQVAIGKFRCRHLARLASHISHLARKWGQAEVPSPGWRLRSSQQEVRVTGAATFDLVTCWGKEEGGGYGVLWRKKTAEGLMMRCLGSQLFKTVICTWLQHELVESVAERDLQDICRRPSILHSANQSLQQFISLSSCLSCFMWKCLLGLLFWGSIFCVLHITLRSHPRQCELSPRVELPTWMTGGVIFYTSVALVLCFDAHLPSCPAIPLPCSLGEKVLLPYTRSHPTPVARGAQSYIGPHVTDCGIHGRAGM